MQQARAGADQVERLALRQLGVRLAGDVGDRIGRGSAPSRTSARSAPSSSRAVSPTARRTAATSSEPPIALLIAASARASWLRRRSACRWRARSTARHDLVARASPGSAARPPRTARRAARRR